MVDINAWTACRGRVPVSDLIALPKILEGLANELRPIVGGNGLWELKVVNYAFSDE